MRSLSTKLPIDQSLPQLIDAFYYSKNVILSAPTGSGKTTRVPLALLKTDWLSDQKIIMLEPRRLAARRAAEYMAAQLGESAGETVGFRIRGDTIIGKRTQIEVVTEGILTQMLQHSPDLPNVGIVIFDEFHERSIHADLGLALALDVQEHLRNNLRILVMSATLDHVAIAQLLGNAPVVESFGYFYPIDTHYARFPSDKPFDGRLVKTIMGAVQEEEGDVLVFLPGQREIRRVENLLWEKNLQEEIIVHSLYGDAPYQQQLAALNPAASGKRKVILSTSIAETSLTIDGVRVVIDSGFARTARFHVRRGMSGLITIPVSKAIADQRRGRAGRQQPGVCYRLWTEAEHSNLPDYPQPEIKNTDLARLALDFAQWGTSEGKNLRFLDPPPMAHLLKAQTLLRDLGAIDLTGKLTPHGQAMAELPIHPRLSNMILRGKELGYGTLACDIAALLEEHDILAGQKDVDIDFSTRLDALYEKRGLNIEIRERILTQSKRLRQSVDIKNKSEVRKGNTVGILLALAYPERIARRREEKGNRYQMVSGATAILPKGSLLARQEFLAIAEAESIGPDVRVYLAAPIAKEDLQKVFSGSIIDEENIYWDSNTKSVIARTVLRIGSVIIAEKQLEPHGEKVKITMLEGIRQMRLECLPWNKESRALQQRSEWLRKYLKRMDWPNLSDSNLLNILEEWLMPFLDDIWRQDQLQKLRLIEILHARFTPAQWHDLERLAPSHIKLPSGSRVNIDYGSGDKPVIAVKIQELFGQIETPHIVNNQVGIILHLLSPASRPLAVTQDLRSFWQTVYPEIRTQMRARYPKHFWPENPQTAKPTSRTARHKK
jgi:ATP-dependent helicase HrpB